MTNTNKLVASSKQNEEKKLLTREEVCQILKIGHSTFNEVKDKLKVIKGDKNKSFYDADEVNKLRVLNDEIKVENLKNQASALVSKKDEKVIGTAYYCWNIFYLIFKNSFIY